MQPHFPRVVSAVVVSAASDLSYVSSECAASSGAAAYARCGCSAAANAASERGPSTDVRVSCVAATFYAADAQRQFATATQHSE